MLDGGTEPRWVGEARAKVGGGAMAEKVWPLLEDFCGLNKYLSSVHTCYQVEGLQGQPGLIRYCAGGEEEAVNWCREKLVAIDPTQRFLTYEILDNNIGFKSYSATLRVVPAGAGEEPGCAIEWSFVADPVEGFTFDGFLGFIELSAHDLAQNIATALQ
ncbi:lachrymatory-factor synthase-like [Diospyros lotus]|uniref:lachrymatory-factor synthase-like n=1 Tax=Diospyros lotus TaxID=55363 RepID=UPI00225412C4|nr:lachrymatory-factor synthase-like [Diospyros lotus]